MSEVKLPEINQQRGNSRGPEGVGQRQGSFANISNNKKSNFAVARERKEVERDAQLLANRIALLKQEEMKTWKKIEETKRRANEVVRLKQKNEQRVQEKMNKIQEQQRNQMLQQQKIQRMKQDREKEKQKIKDAILLHKKEEARQTKFIG